MNKQCEIIRDLLPLYIDDACSNSSIQMIEEHLSQCDECSKIQQSMKSNKYELPLQLEKEEIITRHAKTEKRKTLIVGAGIAGILCIPIIVCLIVNLALGHALDWFFIVLTSLMVFASLVVVPLVVERNKGLYTIFSFTVSLILLLLTCSIYTDGNWFLITVTSVLFGLSVIFTPYMAYALSLPEFWKRNKGLFIFSIDTFMLIIMLLCIGFHNNSSYYWQIMPPIVLFNAGFIWIIFIICKYIKVNKLIRASIASIITGLYIFACNNVINMILGEKLPWPRLNISIWNINTIDGNIKWLILLFSIIISLFCLAIGIATSIKTAKNNK
ncbi:MAG: zf-HC2 domain-containing protein [Coprococcus sp.]